MHALASLSFAFLLGMIAISCDTQASSQPVEAKNLRESGLLESCQTSSQCGGDGLVCVDLQCQPKLRSRLGDFYAATGRELAGAGRAEEAASAFNAALTEYSNAKISPPMDVVCDHGLSLALFEENAKMAEAAARLLHKCVIGVPASSRSARAAFDALARLDPLGLDEQLLARNEAADLYLTQKATKKKAAKLKLDLSVTSKSKRKSFAKFSELLRSEASEEALLACHPGGAEAVNLELRTQVNYRLIMHEEDEALDRAKISVSDLKGGDSGKACLHAYIRSLAEESQKSGPKEDTRWQSEVVVRVGPI